MNEEERLKYMNTAFKGAVKFRNRLLANLSNASAIIMALCR